MDTSLLTQKLLDQAHEWKADGDRIGNGYSIGKFEFAKNFSPQEYGIMLTMALNSGIFKIKTTGDNVQYTIIEFTKEGFECIEKFDWNFDKWSRSKQESKFWKVLTKIGAVLALLLGLIQVYQAVSTSKESNSINEIEVELQRQDSLIQELYKKTYNE